MATALRTGILTLLLLLIAFQDAALAQVVLEGRVVDADSRLPLVSANVGVAGTTAGASTDVDGRFTLEVAALPVTLDVSYVGYDPASLTVSTDRFVEIALQPTHLLLQDLVVTGSRLAPRTVIDSPVPIDNVRVADLIHTGQPSFDKMLMYTVPAFNSSQQTISDATAHFDPADLRGLGPSRTLVLVNGKRKNPSSLVYINDTPGKGEVGVDMKSIPAGAISRIEVLRDGASAQYGSDAIAGVINVILKDDVDRTEVDLFSGVTTEGDGMRLGYSVNTGFRIGEEGFVNVTHSFLDQDKTNRAGTPCTSGANLDTCDGLFGGLFGLVDTDEERAWLRDNPDMGMNVGLPNMTQADVIVNALLPLRNANAEIYGFGGLTYRNGISYALYRAPYWIPDAYNFFHEPGERYEGFQPTFEGDIIDNSATVGIRGLAHAWNFDLSASHGSNAVDYTVEDSQNLDLGAQSPTVFRAGGYAFRHSVMNLDVSRKFGQATFAAGTEFRTENFVAIAGEEASYFGAGAQSFPGLQPRNEVDATRYNAGVYADVGVDLTSDLFLGGAARFENYSDFGENFSWKLNGRLKILDGNGSIRAAASTGFRAPSLHQIHLSIIQTLVSGGTVSNQGTFDNLNPSLRALEVGRLDDEKSVNLTAGLALRPADGLYLSVDVYQVDVDDRIVYSSSIDALSAPPTSTVAQILDQFGITSLKFFVNAVDTRTRGIDFVANYSSFVGAGRATANLAVNLNDTEIRGEIATPDPIREANFEIFDRKEQSRILTGRPSSKVLLGLTYTQGPVRVTLNNTRFGEVTWQHATDPDMDQTFDARIVTDLDVEYTVARGIALGASVNNLLNVYPDEIDNKGDVLTDLGGRFRYPWEVNQFGFAGTIVTGNVRFRF